jgi:FtsH-binding integral membrane protein
VGVNTGVFKREGEGVVSANLFYGFLGMVVMYGLGGTSMVANRVAAAHYFPGGFAIIMFGLVIPIAGIVIATRSNTTFVSFIGYNMVLVPFGVVLGPVLTQYQPDIIEKAFAITCGVTAVMMAAGVAYPRFFASIGGTLFVCLIGLVIVRVAQVFIPAIRDLGWVDWVSAGIFSLYVGYDWYRATAVPKTFVNAVHVAVDLYLDIINLFLSILSILGRKK